MNWNQAAAVARIVASNAATMLVAHNIFTSEQANVAMSAGTEIVTGIAALVPVAHALYAWWANTHKNVVAKANTVINK